MQTVREDIQPGIYSGIPNEAYHAGPGISKSGLWDLLTKSPAHYAFAPREEKNHFNLGEAGHIAVLEPEEFEKRVYRGPDDRRGNKWKDAQEFCQIEGKTLLTSSDYDKALMIRDTVHANPMLNSLISSANSLVEQSAYWIDPETGLLCRVRPDLRRPDLKIIVDLKTTASAQRRDFQASVAKYGYHAQEAFYTDGMAALGEQVDGFIFIAVEKKDPFCLAVYELEPAAVDRGRVKIREALAKYSECKRADTWPGYPQTVQALDIPRWAYSDEEAPVFFDEEAA